MAIHAGFRRKIEREVATLVAARFRGGSSPVGQDYQVNNRASLDADANRVVRAVRRAREVASKIEDEAANLREVRRELDRFASRRSVRRGR